MVSLCMVPFVFSSNESSAIPTWARKYQVSCYMCHSGMPQRNAVGEAFKNNGYRLPGGLDEQFTKQKNVKIGTDDWRSGLNAPATGSFPQFDPLSVILSGNLVNYKDPVYRENTLTGVRTFNAGKELSYNAPNTAALFYAATIGDHLSVFGDTSFANNVAGAAGADVDNGVTSNVRAVLEISRGFNIAIGNAYSLVNYNGTGGGGVTNVSALLPAPQTYAEVNYTRGDKGGVVIVAGTSMATKNTGIVPAENKINDLLYLRGKVKLFGAGLLSGKGGNTGNSYNGNDNQVTIGAGLSYTNNNDLTHSATGAPTAVGVKGFTGTYLGESLVYGADVQGTYNDFLVGVAYSKDRDLGLNNFRAEAGYFVYPWLYAKVAYADLALGQNYGYNPIAPAAIAMHGDTHQPSIIPSITAWIAPNVSLAGTYTYFTKSMKATTTANQEQTNQNTFALAVRAGF